MFKYRKVFLFVNRAVYLLSSAMLVVGLIFTVLPASDAAATVGQTCPDGGEWIKVELGGGSTSYTYTIPDGKQVVEVCYKAGDNTHTYPVIPPAKGSISISNDQFMNNPGNAYLNLSHASFRLQDLATETPTETTPPPTETTPPPTETTPPPTETTPPPTETTPPPTETTPPPTETTPPPTETTPPPTETTPPPTETTPPPTETTPPPTETTPPPTETTPPPTETTPPPTETTPPPTETTPPPTETTPPPVNVLDPLVDYDPYCTADGRMQWTVENPNTVSFNILYWTLDGGPQQDGFSAAPGSTKFTTTPLGTHTITFYYGESQSVSFTHTIVVCPLQIPATGGLLIPVTGSDLNFPLSGWFFGGFGMFGFGMILTGLRKMFNL